MGDGGAAFFVTDSDIHIAADTSATAGTVQIGDVSAVDNDGNIAGHISIGSHAAAVDMIDCAAVHNDGDGSYFAVPGSADQNNVGGQIHRIGFAFKSPAGGISALGISALTDSDFKAVCTEVFAAGII